MKGCNDIRKLIDEAHRPDVLSFEINEHIGRCGECERFASERVALRRLVTSSARVSVPMNFDSVLTARLAEVKSRRAFGWLSPPGYLQLGAATAGLVVMIFAAQYAGLFSNESRRAADSQGNVITPAPPPEAPRYTLPSAAQPATVAPQRERQFFSLVSGGPIRVKRGEASSRSPIATDGYVTAEDGGVVLVRGENGDMDVSMPTVSVGAQPLLYVSAGQRAARSASVGTSF